MSEDGGCIFVYGTLQQGEERAALWPRAPLWIAPAEVSAELYDLGEYPAIVPGTDRVAGELWRFGDDELAETLVALDEIEGYRQLSDDLYVRRFIDCRYGQGQLAKAYAYLFADEPMARRHARILPGASGVCRWRRGATPAR